MRCRQPPSLGSLGGVGPVPQAQVELDGGSGELPVGVRRPRRTAPPRRVTTAGRGPSETSHHSSASSGTTTRSAVLLAPQPRPRAGQEAGRAARRCRRARRSRVDPGLVRAAAAGRATAAIASTAWMVVSWHCRRAQNARGAGASLRKTSGSARSAAPRSTARRSPPARRRAASSAGPARLGRAASNAATSSSPGRSPRTSAAAQRCTMPWCATRSRTVQLGTRRHRRGSAGPLGVPHERDHRGAQAVEVLLGRQAGGHRSSVSPVSRSRASEFPAQNFGRKPCTSTGSSSVSHGSRNRSGASWW